MANSHYYRIKGKSLEEEKKSVNRKERKRQKKGGERKELKVSHQGIISVSRPLGCSSFLPIICHNTVISMLQHGIWIYHLSCT